MWKKNIIFKELMKTNGFFKLTYMCDKLQKKKTIHTLIYTVVKVIMTLIKLITASFCKPSENSW